jgi:hypothetical protein
MEHGERVDEFIKRAAQSAAVRYEEECYHFCGRCESPIEALLVAALFVAAKMGPEHLEFELSDKIETPIPFDEAGMSITSEQRNKLRGTRSATAISKARATRFFASLAAKSGQILKGVLQRLSRT